jgi:hypothetical protein
MRTVKTSSGATAVQVVWSSRRGTREIEHLGSAHDEAELQALKAAALGPFGFGGVEPAGDADRAVGHDPPLHLAGRLLSPDQDHPERPAAFGDIQQELLDRAVPLARRVLVQLIQHDEHQRPRGALEHRPGTRMRAYTPLADGIGDEADRVVCCRAELD